MKKQLKIKLVLNSQTIRRLPTARLQGVQGALVQYRDVDDSLNVCYTDNCRGCG